MLFNREIREVEPEDFVALVSTMVIEEKKNRDAQIVLSEEI